MKKIFVLKTAPDPCLHNLFTFKSKYEAVWLAWGVLGPSILILGLDIHEILVVHIKQTISTYFEIYSILMLTSFFPSIQRSFPWKAILFFWLFSNKKRPSQKNLKHEMTTKMKMSQKRKTTLKMRTPQKWGWRPPHK